MTLNQLRYFQALAQTEHYGLAASRLYISQPSLSRAIALLQEELGVTLFQHKGRNVVLTPAGQAFLPYVDGVLEELDRGVAAMEAYAGRGEKLALGCILPAVNTYLTPMLAEFLRESPSLPQFDIDSAPTEALISGLRQGRYELVFCSYFPRAPGIQFVPVLDMPFVVVLRRDDPLSSLPEITPEELRRSGRPILLTRASAYARLIRQMLEHYGLTNFIEGISNEETTFLSAVQAGLGIFVGTDYPQLHAEGIALVPLRQGDFHRYVYMAYSATRSYSPTLQALIRFNRRRALPREEGLQPHGT